MITVPFITFETSVPEALDAINAAEVFAAQSAILIKPNLINESPPPITTPAACCEAIVRYIKDCSDAEIVIGEGCGTPSFDTDEIFTRLGYREMADTLGVELVDMNNAPLVKREDPDCVVFKEIYLPELVYSHYLISVPVLKAHSLADITGTLKNMIGLAPPKHYEGRYGSWKKAVFHGMMHESITELNRYRAPDMTLMDASVGMADFHLGGATCDPPVRKLLAGLDPHEIDREAATLLGFDWHSIPHLAPAHT